MQSKEKLMHAAEIILTELEDRQYSNQDALAIISHCLVTILVAEKNKRLKNALLGHINEVFEMSTGIR